MMGRNLWLNMAAAGAGVLALAAVIWLAAPLLSIAGYHPFESEGVRLAGIVVVCLGGIGYAAWSAYRQVMAARALGAAVSEAQAEDDGDLLRTRMKEVLATLRASAGGKGDYLYELPWYVIIGPPGSGKTTALINCGLTFPLAGGRTPAAIAGIGGTRYCDWWFTEEAVLIDTAGRYTTQDSNAEADKKSWLAFLGLLKKHRPRQPINGVIVAISIADLVSLDEAEVAAHAAAVRSRLAELHACLKIDFPVYVLFTKMDLVAGFTEFFADLGEMRRRMVWGATFQNPGKNQNFVASVPQEFDALVERLTAFVPDRLQAETDPTARLRLFGFPAQMATLKQPVGTFLARIFEPTRFHANATLRGFYFTSGTQEGTPFDRIIGALSQSFGAQALGEGFLSGTGKSFFLDDLVRKVIIGEAAWVSTDRAAVRRNLALRVAAGVGLALVTAGAVAAWTTSYARNQGLIAATLEGVDAYKAVAPLLGGTMVADRQFERILPPLEDLRRLPTGHAHRDDPVPVAEGFGLSQRERLVSSARAAYRAGLERYLRPRLLFRLEEVLERARSGTAGADRSDLYEAFKVYLMLGGQGPVDQAMILDWTRQDFAAHLYPGPEKAGMRQALQEHVAALLELDMGGGSAIALNGPLVAEIRQSLIRLDIAERAYRILRSRAHTGRVRDWNLAQVGTDMATVFTTRGGAALDTVRVPAFYTHDGFHAGLLDALPTIAAQLEKDRWVLGEAGQQAVVGAQFETLADDILKLYARDFIAAWTDALGRLRLKPLTADKPRYLVLYAVSAAASPLKQIFEEIKVQTQLSRERKPAQGQGGTGQAPAPVIFSGGASAGRMIEDHFRPFHAMLDGGPKGRPVDGVVALFSDIYSGLVGGLNEPGRSAQMTAATRESIRGLRTAAGPFPVPFNQMLRAAADELEGNVAGVVLADLQKSLSESVTQPCQQIISGRYPFTRAAEREVQPVEFGRLFAPGGIMDRFFTQELEALVEKKVPDWTGRRESPVGALLSPSALREFQRALQIRDAFFAQGGNQPGFGFSILALTANDPATTVALDIGGVRVVSPPATAAGQPAAPVLVQWPGPVGASRVALVASAAINPATSYVLAEKTGTWALFRMIEQGRVVRQANDIIVSLKPAQGDAREFRYQITVPSAVNPFTLPALREFQCPVSLQ